MAVECTRIYTCNNSGFILVYLKLITTARYFHYKEEDKKNLRARWQTLLKMMCISVKQIIIEKYTIQQGVEIIKIHIQCG